MDNKQSKNQTTLIPYLKELLLSVEQEIPLSVLLSGRNVDDYVNSLIDHAEILYWTEEGAIKGCIAFYCNDPAKDSAFVTMLVVDPRFQGMGIGRALLKFVMEIARTRSFGMCRLQVHRDNTVAINLYKSLGFEIVDSDNAYFIMNNSL